MALVMMILMTSASLSLHGPLLTAAQKVQGTRRATAAHLFTSVKILQLMARGLVLFLVWMISM